MCGRMMLLVSALLAVSVAAAAEIVAADGFALEPRKGDLLILPFGEGMAYPAEADIPLTAQHLRFSNGMELSMGFFGRFRAGEWEMYGVEDTVDAGLSFSRTNGLLRVAYEGPANNALRVFRARTLGVCAASYRAWRESLGWVRTFADKARTNPALRDFPGTADVWLWDDNAQSRLYNWPLKDDVPVRDVRKIADEMRSLGMDRVLWNSFDGETPEDCAYLRSIGYHVGTYECLRDVFHRGLLAVASTNDYFRAARFLPIADDITRVEADGTFSQAWSIPDKAGKMHPMHALCDMLGLEMCRRFIAPEVRRVGYDSRLMDVQACGGPSSCHSKSHPCTRREALAALKREHRYMCDDLRQITGVEVGNELLADAYHYSEGLTSCPHIFRKELCWRYKDRALYGADVPQGTREVLYNPRYRIPLWELVYHDCTVSYYYWADSTMMYPELAPVKDLFCALYGLPPIYSLNVSTWNRLKGEVAASYRRAIPVARRTMFSRMTEFEILSDDRLLQRTRFANGLTVTANFSEKPVRLPDGRLIPACGYAVDERRACDTEPVEVRVRETAGGPRVFVDGQPTAARMFWGLDNQKRRELTADWRRYRLKVTPPADAGMVRLTLNPDPGCRGRVEVRGVDTNALLRAEKGKTLEVSFEARSVGGLRGFRPALQQVTSGVYEYHGVLDLPPDDPEESNLISQSRGARAAGIRFISFFAPNAFADCGEPIDFAAWDAVVDRLIAAVPDALVIPRVTVNPPDCWFERHPDARIVNERGERINGPSIESEEYRRQAFDFVRRTARHFHGKYPRHFAGLHVTGASTQEWYYYGSWKWLSGYDAATAASYRRWRAEKGLPEADVPTPDERHRAADANGVIDEARHPNVIAFNRFLSERMVDFLGEINQIVRRETEGKKLTFAFYGYHYELVTFAHGYPASGNCALDRLLERWKDAIDILAAPLCYSDRGWLGTSPVIGPAETIRRNGILWLNEDDLRTHLGFEATGDGSFCCLRSARETRDAIRRTTLQEIVRGDAGWWMDHGTGWYDSQAEIWQPVRELAALEERMVARREPYVPEVALIVDEEMLLRLGDGSCAWAHPLINEGRFAVPRAGLSIGQYTAGDVRRRPLDARTRLRLHLVPPGRETDLTAPLPRTADGAVEVSLTKISAPLVHSLAIRAGLKPRLKADEVGKAAVWSGSGLTAVQSLSEGFRDFNEGEVRFYDDSSSCHLQ